MAPSDNSIRCHRWRVCWALVLVAGLLVPPYLPASAAATPLLFAPTFPTFDGGGRVAPAPPTGLASPPLLGSGWPIPARLAAQGASESGTLGTMQPEVQWSPIGRASG